MDNPSSPGFRRGCLALQNCLVETLNDHGHALTSTNAHGFQDDGLAFVFEGVKEGRNDVSTGHYRDASSRSTTCFRILEVLAEDVANASTHAPREVGLGGLYQL